MQEAVPTHKFGAFTAELELDIARAAQILIFCPLCCIVAQIELRAWHVCTYRQPAHL